MISIAMICILKPKTISYSFSIHSKILHHVPSATETQPKHAGTKHTQFNRKETKIITFNNAKNLHNEDEITIKETGEHLYVLDAYVNPDNPKQVLIECDDGNTYTHHEIK